MNNTAPTGLFWGSSVSPAFLTPTKWGLPSLGFSTSLFLNSELSTGERTLSSSPTVFSVACDSQSSFQLLTRKGKSTAWLRGLGWGGPDKCSKLSQGHQPNCGGSQDETFRDARGVMGCSQGDIKNTEDVESTLLLHFQLTLVKVPICKWLLSNWERV
jgi:hypothetical protein